MKSRSLPKSLTVRFAGVTALLAAALLVVGCVVTSVYPYYTDQDLAFEPSLLGDWSGSDQGNSPIKEFTRVEQFGENGYRATSFREDRTNSVICHLFRLQGQLFLDTCPTNHEVDLIPVHQVSKVTQIGSEFENANLSYKWLEELLKKNPKAIRHVIVNDKFEGTNDARIVLTANTAELQKFILKHLNNTNAWKEPERTVRHPRR